MTRRQLVVLTILIPVVAIGGLSIGAALRDDNGSEGIRTESADDEITFEYDYSIPLGTSRRIDDGETVEIVPSVLVVNVGEAIRIVNDDDEGHVVGVFFVGAGETLTQRFTTPGVLSGACTVHSGGEFTLRVEA